MPPPRSLWKGALLVCGEPGTGKSRWIQEEAQLARARVFRWNARIDRSLREGREILHQQVRSREPLFVWIEGADDLTQEAQAFLRRILETTSSNVTCALEVREVWRMSAPIVSRCTTVTMKSDTSYRSQRNQQSAMSLGLLRGQAQPALATWRDIPALRVAAADPYALLQREFGDEPSQTPETMEAIRAIGAGSSPWIQLANLILQRRRVPEED